jgi:hypothetical protein
MGVKVCDVVVVPSTVVCVETAAADDEGVTLLSGIVELLIALVEGCGGVVALLIAFVLLTTDKVDMARVLDC